MNKLILAAVAAAMAIPAAPAPVFAQNTADRTYQRSPHYYRKHCHRTNGKTGTIVGAAGGAVAGHALGGGVLGTVAGGVGGALLGRHVDKRATRAHNRRAGCYS